MERPRSTWIGRTPFSDTDWLRKSTNVSRMVYKRLYKPFVSVWGKVRMTLGKTDWPIYISVSANPFNYIEARN